MSAIWAAIDPGCEHRLGDVLEHIEELFIVPSESTLQASTIKNHLLSLRKFSNYIVINRLDNRQGSQTIDEGRYIDIYKSYKKRKIYSST